MPVLVVDDERAIRRFLRVSLAAHGYQVFEAESGQAALIAVAAHRPPDVVAPQPSHDALARAMASHLEGSQ